MEEAFFFEAADLDFSLESPQHVGEWLEATIEAEGHRAETIQFVFTSDDYLLDLNREYLDHDTYTDIITFDYCEGELIMGDIFISIDRVKENADKLNIPFLDELHRVMVHGVLHLCGYKDKSPGEKAQMTEKEDYYLSLRTF